MVTINGHFQGAGREVFSHHLTYERFWSRYLEVFDEVQVVARVRREEGAVPAAWGRATGPGVTFVAIPDFHGPWQYLRVRGVVDRSIRQAVAGADAYLFRVADQLGTMAWRRLPAGAVFGVEVTSDPWQVFAPGSVRSPARPWVRRVWRRTLRAQCRQAAAAAYVTRHALQRIYPPGAAAYTTHYSSVELDPADLCPDLASRRASLAALPDRLAGRGAAVRLGFMGSFSQGHKLPHVHIAAVAQCIGQGLNVVLDLIGDGARMDKAKSLARALGVADRVFFQGRVAGGKAVLEAMDRWDLLLNATAAEGLPRVVIEAMARGCPCIASDVGGTSELLDRPFLVRPGRIDDLAGALRLVLTEPKILIQAAEQNLARARDYCKDSLQPRRREFYRALRERTERAPGT